MKKATPVEWQHYFENKLLIHVIYSLSTKAKGLTNSLIQPLNSTDCLLVRLKNEISRSAAEYKKLKSGHQKSKFEQDLKIKISGDGAKVSRVSNFLVVSFSVLDDNSNSHMSQRVLAVVNCDENYSNLKPSLGPLFQEINQLHSKQYLDVDGRKIKLEMFIGGDMKFIQLLLGMNSSIATYACPWCKVSKERRGDISLPWDFYHGQNIARSVEEMNLSNQHRPKQILGLKILLC